jgi:hypothetical protein
MALRGVVYRRGSRGSRTPSSQRWRLDRLCPIFTRPFLIPVNPVNPVKKILRVLECSRPGDQMVKKRNKQMGRRASCVRSFLIKSAEVIVCPS